jgi:hypothetical protein
MIPSGKAPIAAHGAVSSAAVVIVSSHCAPLGL